MSKLQELIAEKTRLESEISALISASRKEAIDKVRALIQEFDLTAEEIGRAGTSSRAAKRVAARASRVSRCSPSIATLKPVRRGAVAVWRRAGSPARTARPS